MIHVAVCCLPYLARREVLISNKAEVVQAGGETLLCTLELKRKDSSASIDNIRLKYELYARSSLVEDTNVAHCYVSRISRNNCNVYINISASTAVKLTRVKLDLGWKYRLSDNEIKFKVKTSSPMLNPVSSANNCSRPDLSALSMSDEYSPRMPNIKHCQLNKSPVSQCYILPSPTSTNSAFSFSDYEISQRTTSYYLSHPKASVCHSSVEAAKLPDGIGIIDAGAPIYFKVILKDAEGMPLPKKTKLKLSVELGNETIFTGVTHKTLFKLTKKRAKEFTVLFYINEEIVPGGPFYVNVQPLAASSLANFTFDEDSARVKRFKTQSNALYVGLWMLCHADIVDKHGNKVHINCNVVVSTEPVIEVTELDIQEGQLKFRTKAEEIGKVEFSFVLKKEDSQTDIVVKKEVNVKKLSMVDQIVLKSYV